MSQPSPKMTHLTIDHAGHTYRVEIEPDCNGAALCGIWRYHRGRAIEIELSELLEALTVTGDYDDHEHALYWLLSDAEDKLASLYRENKERLERIRECHDDMRKERIEEPYHGL